MAHRRTELESVAMKYIINGFWRPQYRTLVMIAGMMYGKEILMIRHKVCPFCGQVLRRRCRVWAHLNHPGKRGCREAFLAMVDDVVRTTMRAIDERKRRIKAVRTKTWGTLYKVVGWPWERFSTTSQALYALLAREIIPNNSSGGRS